MKRLDNPNRLGMSNGLLWLTFVVACPTAVYLAEKFAKPAMDSIIAARAIASKAHPGAITDEELEREAGGTGLRYSFHIRSGTSTQEVGVDARTGRVLENASEGKNPV